MVSELLCAAILFDLDGVLVHSADSVRRSWHNWAGEHGFTVSQVKSAARGRRTVDTIRELAPELDAPRTAAELEAAQAFDLSDVLASGGARELLGSLDEDEWAVVTSGTRHLALARIRAAGIPEPAVLVTGDDVTAGKPDPEGYLLASARLGHDPSGCVVVEDAVAGVQAARRAAMRVIGLTNGHDDHALSEIDLLVDSCADLRISRRQGAAVAERIIIGVSDAAAENT